MDAEEILSYLLAFFLPGIPGILLWFFLQPATFWQRLAWFIVSAIFYLITFRVITQEI